MPTKWLVSFGKRPASISRVADNSRPAKWASLIVKSSLSNPALKLAQHQLADHVHTGFAVVQARDEGKLLAAIVLEDLGVFLRDLFQRLQAIGGETGRDHRDAAHAFLRELLHRFVGIGLQPLVEAEA